jgi:hypothetical protein
MRNPMAMLRRRVAAGPGSKLAAYTHILQLGSERIPPPTIDDVVAETRQTYGGRWPSVMI